jgi:multicomponent Na+:H+ antiporter subunit F
METFYLVVALLLVANIIAGLFRVFLGPTPADRMLSAQLFGTTGTAVFLLLAETFGVPAMRDAALVLVVLSVMAVVAFVRKLEALPPEEADESD